jgi:hypothetical protein
VWNPSTTSYAFDAFGNRTSMTVAGNATTYAYDDNDRITSVTPPSPASVINYTWDDPSRKDDLTARERFFLLGKGFLRGPHGLGDGELDHDDVRLPRRWATRFARGQGYLAQLPVNFGSRFSWKAATASW